MVDSDANTVALSPEEKEQNLRRAIKFFRTFKVPDQVKWNMGSWGYHRGDHSPPEQNYCGTALCAAGLLAVFGDIPGFRGKWTMTLEEDNGQMNYELIADAPNHSFIVLTECLLGIDPKTALGDMLPVHPWFLDGKNGYTPKTLEDIANQLEKFLP